MANTPTSSGFPVGTTNEASRGGFSFVSTKFAGATGPARAAGLLPCSPRAAAASRATAAGSGVVRDTQHGNPPEQGSWAGQERGNRTEWPGVGLERQPGEAFQVG